MFVLGAYILGVPYGVHEVAKHLSSRFRAPWRPSPARLSLNRTGLGEPLEPQQAERCGGDQEGDRQTGDLGR